MPPPEEQEQICADVANYLTVTPATHPDHRDQQFCVISYVVAEGNGEMAFEVSEAEKLVGGLIDALASSGSALGMMLMDALEQATDTEDTKDGTDEAQTGSPEEDADFSGDADDANSDSPRGI